MNIKTSHPTIVTLWVVVVVMHFCTQCNFMLYVSLSEEDENRLVLNCRNCGHTETDISMKNLVVSHQQFRNVQQEFNHIINPYTKLDPTLPRVHDILCPNPQCLTNTAEETHPRDILYIRYNHTQMKYVYLCSTCDQVWKTNAKDQT